MTVITGGRVIISARVMTCPFCQQPVPVAVSEHGRVASHQRCRQCAEEIRVRSATLRERIAAYLAGEEAGNGKAPAQSPEPGPWGCP